MFGLLLLLLFSLTFGLTFWFNIMVRYFGLLFWSDILACYFCNQKPDNILLSDTGLTLHTKMPHRIVRLAGHCILLRNILNYTRIHPYQSIRPVQQQTVYAEYIFILYSNYLYNTPLSICISLSYFAMPFCYATALGYLTKQFCYATTLSNFAKLLLRTISLS